MPVSVTYSTDEACKRASLTFRQVDYWLRQGAIRLTLPVSGTPGSGFPRRWTEKEVAVLVAIGRVARDFTRIGSDMPTAIVSSLWRDLLRDNFATYRFDTLTVEVHLA